MTQPKLPIGEREAILLETISKHGEVSQNELLEELAPKMAGNTTRKMLQTLRGKRQIDYYKKKNKYVWYVNPTFSENREATQQALAFIEREVRKTYHTYKTLSLAEKLNRCRALSKLCFNIVNLTIFLSLSKDTKRNKEAIESCVKYLKVIYHTILTTPEDAEIVIRGVFGLLTDMKPEELEKLWNEEKVKL